MNEELFQFIWQTGLFNSFELKTSKGQKVEIFKRGILNTNAGPDFLNAHVKIDDTLWIGNVELHTHSHLWNTHKHQDNPAYNNTILHVVLKDDMDCFRNDGSLLPCIALENKIQTSLLQHYDFLKGNQDWVSCAKRLSLIDQFTISQVIERKSIERLERKTNWVKGLLQQSNNDWHTVFYVSIARCFGFGINGSAFEQLAFSLPITIIAKHQSNLLQIESLIFGVAGYLSEKINCKYHETLRKEWQFLSKKYHLKAMDKTVFKQMRMRPGNLPTMRLAQFSKLIYNSHHLLSQVIEETDVKKILNFFKSPGSEYWQTHYVFGKESKQHSTDLSVSSMQSVLINSVVPVLFVYGQLLSNESISQKALNILHQLPSESNQIITHWSQYGIHSRTAFDSQALIELKQNNCDLKLCLNCKIGSKILSLK
jgi:hypothetical protein